ncbi:HEPN domain-containing protein [Methanobrevibacter filiformis]|uniref:HEPN domain protein n=1 Tax=Methanobrevibacter filiformis TaxID=55758 RepID=A0A166A2K7_9EURY|nr:HEPN domain-containing protein [Methanobrevibacter filiformis]KZX11482.1 HEPN domain protein [Methanobrevibacter filiformis]
MDEDVKLLFNKSLESLEVLEFDINGGYYDASINRSYYAVFYAARSLLLKRGIEPKKHSEQFINLGWNM